MPHMLLMSSDDLKCQLASLSDIDKYKLLATLRTGQPLSESRQVLRWYFLRMIVARAYMKSYKTSYAVRREWYETDARDADPYLSYEMEIDRITILVEHIKRYNFTGKPFPNFTRDMAAVAMALKAYYRRFTLYDMTKHMELKGIAFTRTYFMTNYGSTRREKRSRYTTLVQMEALLRKAGWDAEKALNMWLEYRREKAETADEGMTYNNYKSNYKPPTKAMALGMYNRIIRHMQVNQVIGALSYDELTGQEWGDIYEENAKSALRCCYDASDRYEQLRNEVFRVNRREKRHGYRND